MTLGRRELGRPRLQTQCYDDVRSSAGKYLCACYAPGTVFGYSRHVTRQNRRPWLHSGAGRPGERVERRTVLDRHTGVSYVMRTVWQEEKCYRKGEEKADKSKQQSRGFGGEGGDDLKWGDQGRPQAKAQRRDASRGAAIRRRGVP